MRLAVRRSSVRSGEAFMSQSLVWFAVKGVEPAEFLSRAGLVDTEEPDEFFDADTAGAQYPDGWFVVTSEDFSMMDMENLKEWSEGGRLVAVAVDEEVLSSLATEWANGKLVWSVSHEVGEDDSDEPQLQVEGTLPAFFEEVRAEYSGSLDGEDPAELAFEIPFELASRITGFHHDDIGFEDDAPVFTVLEQE